MKVNSSESHIAEVTCHQSAHTYPIIQTPDFVSAAQLCRQYLVGEQALIITDEHVGPLYLPTLQSALGDCQSITIAAGETSKSIATITNIAEQLSALGQRRNTTLIALGGGVVGDITGFVAATYLRGVAYVQMPTTLLAQTDAAIGGKTGVNLATGKNLLGAFHHPKAVLSATDVLQTLPAAEFRAGLGEVIKYALLADAEFFTWLEKAMPDILRHQPQALAHIITTCSRIKAQIVSRDAQEQGERALLNLGHTFAHALETASDYTLLHGEAVAIGLVLAGQLSQTLGYLSQADCERIENLCRAAQLPHKVPAHLSAQTLLEYMQHDKKHIDAGLRLIVLQQIGTAKIEQALAAKQVLPILEKNR